MINLLNNNYPHSYLDTEYVIPKITRGFIGEHIDVISCDPNYVQNHPVTVPPTAEAGAAGDSAPSGAGGAAVPTPAPVAIDPHVALVR